MVYKQYPHVPPAPSPAIELGTRLKHDIRCQIRVLEGRFHPSHADLQELGRLRQLLQLMRKDDGND